MSEKPQPGVAPAWLLRVAVGLACLLSGLSMLLVPWQQVHPSDPSLRVSLGYAPVWSSRFSEVPGAHVDLFSTIVNVLVIWSLFIAVIVVAAAWKSND